MNNLLHKLYSMIHTVWIITATVLHTMAVRQQIIFCQKDNHRVNAEANWKGMMMYKEHVEF